MCSWGGRPAVCPGSWRPLCEVTAGTLCPHGIKWLLRERFLSETANPYADYSPLPILKILISAVVFRMFIDHALVFPHKNFCDARNPQIILRSLKKAQRPSPKSRAMNSVREIKARN